MTSIAVASTKYLQKYSSKIHLYQTSESDNCLNLYKVVTGVQIVDDSMNIVSKINAQIITLLVTLFKIILFSILYSNYKLGQ